MHPDISFQGLCSYSNTFPYTTFIHQRQGIADRDQFSLHALTPPFSLSLPPSRRGCSKGVAYKSVGGLSMNTYSFICVGYTVALLQGLRSVFPKCAVGTLSNNSHNILQIIVEAYNVSEAETPFPPRSLASCVWPADTSSSLRG